jgi:hypothetical protein
MRLRQVALVAAQLEPAVTDLTALLGIKVAYNDPGVGKFGLENAVMAVGETFLEVVVPTQAGTTAGRLLEKRGGDGGYMAIFQVEDIEKARALLAQNNVRVVEQAEGPRYAMSHLHPKDIGGAIVSVDQMTPWEHWEWAGPNWRETIDTSVTTAIVGVEIQSDDPDAMADRWSRVLGQPRQGLVIPMRDSVVRFVKAADGRGDGVSAFDVAVHDVAGFRARAEKLGLVDAQGAITACGTRIWPRPA